MKKISLLVVGLLCISLSSFAGEVITNDTGEDATGLRVVLSTPVKITAFGDVLTHVDQEGPTDEFVFTGGTVAVWGSHWLSWTPASAKIISHEWLTGSNATLQGLPAEQRADRPVVTGNLLNPHYFAHPAYVMQGVSEKDAIFALPLDGIQELEFYPIVEGVDPDDVTWSVEISHPEGIGTSIEGKTLYIWGSNASWAGYGAVTLEAVLGDAISSVTIPVTVFRDDKTLINAEGKKDYFVPWSPELDVNRILSVEEHMRKYNKDEGSLDRTIQWSRWKKMEQEHDVELGAMWLNSKTAYDPWPLTSQMALVDVYLSEIASLGIDSVTFWNSYYIDSKTSTDIHAQYNTRYCGGGPPTKTVEEVAYIVDEAHRLGMTVMVGLVVSIGNPTTNLWREIYYASPSPLGAFFSNYTKILAEYLQDWQQLGVDMVDLCPALSSLNEYKNTYEQAIAISNELRILVSTARGIYSGPLYHGAHFPPEFFPGRSILYAPFWTSFDVIALSGWSGVDLSSDPDPSFEQLVSGWKRLIRDVFEPFQKRFNRPFGMWENGCLAAEGCSRVGLICERMDFFDPTKPDTEEMARYFIAHEAAFRGLNGYYRPGWHRYPLVPYIKGGVRDASQNTMRLKIDDTLRELCSAASDAEAIRVDGDLSDWRSSGAWIWVDQVGDTYRSQDLVSLAHLQDDNYLYFLVEYSSSPSGQLIVEFDTDEDLQSDFYGYLSNLYSDDGSWWSSSRLYLTDRTWIGVIDSVASDHEIELRINLRFIRDIATQECLNVRLLHYESGSASSLADETPWISLGAEPQLVQEPIFELLGAGSLTQGASSVEGTGCILGECQDTDSSYTPYMRTVPRLLPLQSGGEYSVCFNYRIVESSSDGFEVLFFSPSGAQRNEWVFPLVIVGADGKSGNACLEGQLHSYSDYEIRWNVVSTGSIAIDNIVVRDLATNQIIAEEDFEDWK